MRNRLLLVLALCLLISPVTAATQAGVSIAPPGEETAAPDFEFRPVGGKSFSLSSLRGRVTILKFWATWCHDCVREMPQARALVERFAPRGVQFLGISKDAKKTPAEVLEAARGYGQLYPLMVDQGPKEQRVTTLYNISWIPTVFLIDAAGQVHAVAKDLDGDNLEKFAGVVERLIGEAEPALSDPTFIGPVAPEVVPAK